MKFTIDRSKWARGEEDAVLRDSRTGRMCCLGFFGLACGIDSYWLSDVAEPKDVGTAKWPDWMSPESSTTGARLMLANDSVSMSDEERERLLISLFAKHGVVV